MNIPQINLSASVTPLTSIDLSVHQLIGVSWHILLPYTFFGTGLMLYSQFRFISGQRNINKLHKKNKRKKPKHNIFYAIGHKLSTDFSIF